MSLSLIFAMLILTQPDGPATNTSCAYDHAAMMALAQREFDQDMQGGWRKLAASGCEVEAADLIKDWRHVHSNDSGLLFWHEGQLRASAGQDEAAMLLFEKARRDKVEDAQWGWNLYVDGSIAFLAKDKTALIAAREKLAALPEPESARTMVDQNGKPSRIKWPMNLRVLDGFIRCWGSSYKQAYACPVDADGESKRAP